MHIPENVKLWESPGKAGGLPNCNYFTRLPETSSSTLPKQTRSLSSQLTSFNRQTVETGSEKALPLFFGSIPHTCFLSIIINIDG